MLKTKFPYGSVDFEKYYQAYMKREDAIRSVPTEEELAELAHKGLVKDHLILLPVPKTDAAQIGDTVTFKTESQIPKFNKEKVTVSIGRGLYNKDLENAAVGKTVNESYYITVDDKQVTVKVLEIKRKQEPSEVTDDMAAALRLKDDDGTPVTTVEQYMAFMKKQKKMECLANVNYYIMEKLLEDYPVTECDADDLDRLAELERDFFEKIYREQEGIDVNAVSKEQAQEMWNCDSFDGFIKLRYEWYRMKIQQCLVYRNILGLEGNPAYDYTDRYEVLSELQLKMFEMLEERLNGGNR